MNKLLRFFQELKLRLSSMKPIKYDYISESWLKEHEKWENKK